MAALKVVEITRRIWMNVLGTDALSQDADFFEFGGDSLAALNMLFMVGQAFHLEVDPATLYDNPTLNSFAQAIQKRLEEEADPVDTSLGSSIGQGIGIQDT